MRESLPEYYIDGLGWRTQLSVWASLIIIYISFLSSLSLLISWEKLALVASCWCPYLEYSGNQLLLIVVLNMTIVRNRIMIFTRNT